MYPVLFRIGHVHIATYGLVVALAFMAATALAAKGFRDRNMDGDEAWNLLWYAMIGGFVGAKLYYVALHGPEALLSRAGMVWYGGLVGGALAVAWGIRRRGLPFRPTLDVFAPSLALGHAVGHVACFFSGDSYGVPSDLPWAVAFPHGAPPSTAGNLRAAFGVNVPAAIPDDAVLRVHPTMLYSAIVLLLVTAFLWWYRSRSDVPGRLFSLYLILAGVERFFVEFLRAKDDRLLLGMTTAQAVAATLFATGCVLLWRWRRSGGTTTPHELRPDGDGLATQAPA